MFETAELGNKVSREEYEHEEPILRMQLLNLQRELATSGLGVVVVLSGVEGAGKSETVNLLHEWMDARGIQVHAMWDPTDEERERPPMWRFWRVLPPKGRIGIFFGSWYSAPIIDRVFKRINDNQLDRHLSEVVDFEQMLANEDVLVVKLWMHISKSVQRKRLKELEKDPKTSWRVSKLDWKFFKKYDKFRAISEHALRNTSTGVAPWNIVEAEDSRYRSLTVGRILFKAIRERLDLLAKRPPFKRTPDLPKPAAVNILNRLDMTLKVPDEEYREQLVKQMAAVNLLSRKLYERKKSALFVFEGPDAAGKGGAIRRLTSAIDSRMFQVISIAAPTDEERARPYLWRFWRQIPRLGRVTIFDRSWYGRVLVERIEGFCGRDDWQRAFAEINSFEGQLADFGTIIGKFWLTISPDEQLNRFSDRERTPYKQYKLTEEDWRNREKWDAYEAAACDMVERTSTEHAPWILVEANDKNHARVKVLASAAALLRKALGE